MSCTFTRPKGLKYTDMAIYIDKHLADIKEPNLNPEVEAKIYEYIYHILYALSCKAGYFKNFADYDSFACYGACELYVSMRKKLINEGKEVRGKKVVPIKSSLNFIKATMFPLKVNYQRETFMQVLDPAIHDSAETYREESREAIQSQYRRHLLENLIDVIDIIPKLCEQVLDLTPFKYDEDMRRKLKMSIILTLLDDLTIPNKLRNKLEAKKATEAGDKMIQRLTFAYQDNPQSVIIWHLDERYATYIRLLTQRLKRWIGNELKIAIHSDDLSDTILDSIINSAYQSHSTEKVSE